MKAAVFAGVRDLRIQTIADPEPTADDIVVRVQSCGICGSDLHSYATGAFVQPGQVMGHEFCGEVVEVGRGVQGIEKGDVVTAMPYSGCYRCPPCMRGDYHLCDHIFGHAIAYGLPGAFAELVRVPRATLGRNVFKLPPGVSSTAGALVEPLSVAVHAVELARPALGSKVVVIGAGLIGQCVIQVLKAKGVGAVVVSEPAAGRAEMARRSGADVVVNPAAADVVRQVAEVVGFGAGGRGAAADVVFDCAGVPGALAEAFRLLRPGGTLTVVALYEEPVRLDPNLLVWKEVRVLGAFGYRDEFPTAIELLRSGRVKTEFLVTDAFPLDRIAEGFERQRSKDKTLKVVITP